MTFDSSTIRVLLEPTIYLLGRQETNDEEVDRFLADHGVSWQTDTEVAAEHLVEVAGRRVLYVLREASAGWQPRLC